jgi:hypothetical protein
LHSHLPPPLSLFPPLSLSPILNSAAGPLNLTNLSLSPSRSLSLSRSLSFSLSLFLLSLRLRESQTLHSLAGSVSRPALISLPFPSLPLSLAVFHCWQLGVMRGEERERV